MCPWNIRSWLLWRSASLSSHLPLVHGDKSVQLGELEDRSLCWLWPLCLLESACSGRVSAGHGARGHPLAARPAQVQMEKVQQRGRPGRVTPRNVLRPHLRVLTFARAMLWFVLSDCSGDVGKGDKKKPGTEPL